MSSSFSLPSRGASVCLSHLSREIKKIKSVGFPALVMLGGEWEVPQKEQHSFMRIVRVSLRREVVRMTVKWKILNVLASKLVIMFLSTVTNRLRLGSHFLQYNSDLLILHFAVSYLTFFFFLISTFLVIFFFFFPLRSVVWPRDDLQWLLPDDPGNQDEPHSPGQGGRKPAPWRIWQRWVRQSISTTILCAPVGTAFVGFNAEFCGGWGGVLLGLKQCVWSLVSSTLSGTSPVSLSVLSFLSPIPPPPSLFPCC